MNLIDLFEFKAKRHSVTYIRHNAVIECINVCDDKMKMILVGNYYYITFRLDVVKKEFIIRNDESQGGDFNIINFLFKKHFL